MEFKDKLNKARLYRAAHLHIGGLERPDRQAGIFAEDADGGKVYDIEIRRNDAGVLSGWERYNSSLMDANVSYALTWAFN